MVNFKEAQARIKIDELLKQAGWRFFDNENDSANIQLEPGVKLTKIVLDALGNDFEKEVKGYVDYSLLDDDGDPIIVIEAKKESIHPLEAKEQARKYANVQRCRFVILTNGNTHYFWDIEHGNPQIITDFPTLESLYHRKKFKPDMNALADEYVDDGYIARIKDENYFDDPRYQDENTRTTYLKDKGLIILRPFQLDAIHKLQSAAKNGQERYLFEMATGTGKTLTTAAVARLFLRTGNARRILFLVDRIELENQAEKALKKVLGDDYIIKTFKQNRDSWKSAQIVVSTVQSLLAGDKYRKEFSPTDFELVISDEAHRSLGGNSRSVFEYFNGYKLGLTATPKDYLKNVEDKDDPRTSERRELLDTYRTFGCESGVPTFRYNLSQGAKDGYLVQPKVFDARTQITTQLLSDEGYAVLAANEDGDEVEETFTHRDYERKFYNTETNIAFCKTLIDHCVTDPITQEIGKTLVFCVSQKHARKITEILNLMADKKYPGKYNSDFAVQVTSTIKDAQDKTVRFANDNLSGNSKFKEGYKTSKTRVCVTVGMMTTGYDAPNILNLALMRPIFSPSDFVQMKGRGTRRHTFSYGDDKYEKENFYLFDFFGNYEYFEEKFDYDEVLKLPALQHTETNTDDQEIKKKIESLDLDQLDAIKQIDKTEVGEEGMVIDRELYHETFEKIIKEDGELQDIYTQNGIDGVKEYVMSEILNKPKEYFTPEKLRESITSDRWISFKEILQKAFGEIDTFKNLDEKTEEEFKKFQDIEELDANVVPEARWFFSAYLQDKDLRGVIESEQFGRLPAMAGVDFDAFKKLAETKRNGGSYAQYIPIYIHDYVDNLKTFEQV